MFNIRNMKVLLVVLVTFFLLCSSVNMVPARPSLEEIIEISKRQGGGKCPILDYLLCNTDEDCLAYDSMGYRCRSKLLKCLV